jgi:hypothetical protein
MQAAVRRAVNRRAMPVAGLKAVLRKGAEAGRRAAATVAEDTAVEAVAVAEAEAEDTAAAVAAEAEAVHQISTADRAHPQVVAACSSVIRAPPPQQAVAEAEAVHQISTADRAHPQVAAACSSVIRAPPPQQAVAEPETPARAAPAHGAITCSGMAVAPFASPIDRPISQPVCAARRIKFAGLA